MPITSEKLEELRSEVATESYNSLTLMRKFQILADKIKIHYYLAYKIQLVTDFTILK